jgi:hypothetical protein
MIEMKYAITHSWMWTEGEGGDALIPVLEHLYLGLNGLLSFPY